MFASWINKQRQLLELERESEREQLLDKLASLPPKECEEFGISLLGLVIENIRTAMYGKSCITIQKKNALKLPVNNFKVGDEVKLYSSKTQHTSNSEASIVKGIISKLNSSCIEIITDDGDGESMDYPLRLDMLSSDVTHKKILDSLNELEKNEGSSWPLINILFNNAHPGFVQNIEIQPFNLNLNSSQIQAVQHALGSPHIALIHGPPGTGKTTTIVELIQQALQLGSKLLVCAPSNVAVDNILEKLVTSSNAIFIKHHSIPKPRVVRLGHPARISDITQSHSLDALILNHDGTEIVKDVRKEMDSIHNALRKSKSKSSKREMQIELRQLRKEARKREEAVVKNILTTRNVILSTLVGASSKMIKNIEFDLVIIDEAAQALEAACWIPMLKSNKVILAGDHCQLPPTIKSTVAEKAGLGITLFERIITSTANPIPLNGEAGLDSVSRLLNTQYRMPAVICDWASAAMYHNQLLCHVAVASHSLSGLTALNLSALDDVASAVMVLIDTSGCLMEEEDCRGGSYRNHAEAAIVASHVRKLLASGLPPEDIGIVTPYNGQVEVLRTLLHEDFPRLSIRTVDGFQGGEKEAIIISMVRSNGKKQVGFLADKRRINVAVTRARKHLAVIADTDTCASDSFLKGLMDHISTYGEHRSALEFSATTTITSTTTANNSSNNNQSQNGKDSRNIELLPSNDNDVTETVIPETAGSLPLHNTSNTAATTAVPFESTAIGVAVGTTSPTGNQQQQQQHLLPTSSNGSISLDHLTNNNNNIKTSSSSSSCSTKPDRKLQNKNRKESSKKIYSIGSSIGSKAPSPPAAAEEETAIQLERCILLFLQQSTGGASVADSDSICGYRVQDDSLPQESSTSTSGYKLQVDVTVPQHTVRFPPTLSNYQRLRVHIKAEELKLLHLSSGEGDSRYIEVSLRDRPPVIQKINNNNVNKRVDVNDNTLNTATTITTATTTPTTPTAIIMDSPFFSSNPFIMKQDDDDDEEEELKSTSIPNSLTRSSAEVDSSYWKLEAESQTDAAITIASTNNTTNTSKTSSNTTTTTTNNNSNSNNNNSSSSNNNSKNLPLPNPRTTKDKQIQTKKQNKKQMETIDITTNPALDEDTLLASLIEKNKLQAIEKQRLYRVSATAMPNPETERSRQQLRKILNTGQEIRKAKINTIHDSSENSNSNNNHSGKSSNKKVLKKPVRNFGGGRLGGGIEDGKGNT